MPPRDAFVNPLDRSPRASSLRSPIWRGIEGADYPGYMRDLPPASMAVGAGRSAGPWMTADQRKHATRGVQWLPSRPSPARSRATCAALFERHTFLVVESGSTDGTRRALRQWHRDDPSHVELILPTSGKPHHGYWRNRYLEVVLREPLRFWEVAQHREEQCQESRAEGAEIFQGYIYVPRGIYFSGNR